MQKKSSTELVGTPGGKSSGKFTSNDPVRNAQGDRIRLYQFAAETAGRLLWMPNEKRADFRRLVQDLLDCKET